MQILLVVLNMFNDKDIIQNSIDIKMKWTLIGNSEDELIIEPFYILKPEAWIFRTMYSSSP